VPRAIAETRRVLRDGGHVAGLTIRASRWGAVARAQRAVLRMTGAQPFDFDALGEQFRAHGFTGWRWEGAPLIGWFSARAGG
jgi:hypothetical protein